MAATFQADLGRLNQLARECENLMDVVGAPVNGHLAFPVALHPHREFTHAELFNGPESLQQRTELLSRRDRFRSREERHDRRVAALDARAANLDAKEVCLSTLAVKLQDMYVRVSAMRQGVVDRERAVEVREALLNDRQGKQHALWAYLDEWEMELALDQHGRES